MTLHVQTARISYGGPDRLDVSRQSGRGLGRAFAPSWRILRPALDARKAAKAEAPGLADIAAEKAWAEYVPAYLAEMRHSYRTNPAAWSALLARERAVLCCYCREDDGRCHRFLLAEILVKLGATYEGEL